MKKYFLIILSFFCLHAENWKRIPGSSDDVWALRQEGARGSLAALDLSSLEPVQYDSFESMLDEKLSADVPLKVVQVIPEGESTASYYADETWQGVVSASQERQAFSYGLDIDFFRNLLLIRRYPWTREWL